MKKNKIAQSRSNKNFSGDPAHTINTYSIWESKALEALHAAPQPR